MKKYILTILMVASLATAGCTLDNQTSQTPDNSSDKTGTNYQTQSIIENDYADAIKWSKTTQTAGIDNCGSNDQIQLGNTTYCKQETNEGAAGSTYTTYTYSGSAGKYNTIIEFTLRFPNCGNYPDNEITTCESDQNKVNPNSIAENLLNNY